ncbi:hypothetical protein TWF281_004855 [Arthrobotrys megalospora]
MLLTILRSQQRTPHQLSLSQQYHQFTTITITMNPIFKTTFLGGEVYRPYGSTCLPAFGPCSFVEHLKAVLPVPSPLSDVGPCKFVEQLSAALPEHPAPPTPQEEALTWWRQVREEWKEDKSLGLDENWAPLAPIMDQLFLVNYDLDTFYNLGINPERIEHTPLWNRPAMKVPTYRARLHFNQQTHYGIRAQTFLLDRSAVGPLTVGDVVSGFAALLGKRLSASQRQQLRAAQILHTGNLRAKPNYSHNGTQLDLIKAGPGLRGKHTLIVEFGGIEKDGTVKLRGWWLLADKKKADPPPRTGETLMRNEKRHREEEGMRGNKRQRV